MTMQLLEHQMTRRLAPRLLNANVAYLSSYPPRECGIATFTHDLVTAIDGVEPRHRRAIVAMQEGDDSYAYGHVVKHMLDQDDLDGYRRVAEAINAGQTAVVNIQHEFGLFGGTNGTHLLTLLRTLRKPVVLTFHTVLAEPNADLRAVVRQICELSSAVVVLSRWAIDILARDYGVDRRKVRHIPHGVPSAPRAAQTRYKSELGLAGRTVLSTFGLINPDKGIEYALDALPSIVEQHPEVLYLVLGETHPVVRRRSGEAYRTSLTNRVQQLGLTNHVRFYNQYLSDSALVEHLMATDVLLVLNQNLQQYCSGTLAYAVGCGRAVVATPFVYAKELLDCGRGSIVGRRDSAGIGSAVQAILSDPDHKATLEAAAYAYGRQMQWPVVASEYLKVYDQVASTMVTRPLSGRPDAVARDLVAAAGQR